MTPKELQLLFELRQNAREKLTAISKKTNIPISTLFDMLKEMTGTTIIKSTVLINFEELGYSVRTQIVMKALHNGKLEKHLSCNRSVNNILKTTDGFIVETVHRNMKELNAFLEKLRELDVGETQVHYLVDEVKREGFVVV
jgi:DNA-binding Lrp family transcriptional regulator